MAKNQNQNVAPQILEDLTVVTEETTQTPAPAPITDVEYAAAKLKELTTKSAAIRYLSAEGWKRGRIAKALGIRYQFVRNVLVAIPKKSEPTTVAGNATQIG